MIKLSISVSFFLIGLLFATFPAFAYMGPGAGLTAFGCLVALLAGIWYTCKGFLWLPLKRKFGKKTATTEEQQQPVSKEAADEASKPS